MPEMYQKDYDTLVKTFYERLEIKRQGGEFATKESFKKLGSLEDIWEFTDILIRFKGDKEKAREGACNAADEMEKGQSDPDKWVEDYCEKTFFGTVTTGKR
ncbi:hypothetical protein EAE96_010885 [Botrytis aclada]|nr:hypothetical protein EAE96_010885 [Botrytis aclada]